MMYPVQLSPGFHSILEPKWGFETQLVKQWLNLNSGTVLRDIRGRTVYIIDPGQRNRHEGPDIQNAVINIDNSLLTGSVECHVESKHWREHKHQINPAYEAVILHVVRHVNRGKFIPEIPTVVLPETADEDSPGCDLDAWMIRSDVAVIIRKLAERRWQRQLTRFMVNPEPYETNRRRLLIRNFRILGAGGNQDTFDALARHLKAERILNISVEEGVAYLQSLADRLKLSWHRRGLRPANHPEKRIITAVVLVRFLWDTILLNITSPRALKTTLNEVLGQVSGIGLRVELLGNVFYPFFGAKALGERDIDLYHIWLKAWFDLVLPYSYQKYEQQFRNIFHPSALKSFSFLQGLKRLDSHYCNSLACRVCPLKDFYGNLQ